MFRIGQARDIHRLENNGRNFVLGGVIIPSSKGPVSHSDGDCLYHAVCESLLGGLALGDLGHHFPDDDLKYKDIDSSLLIKKTMELVKEKGYRISNIDCTIAMQRPKLRPHIDTMRLRLAEVVDIDVERISVKATTTEHLGFEGREEGVSATAVTLLIKE